MAWLNYQHLYYFWTVARTGSIAAAGRELFLSPPAISNQLKTLETAMGASLFHRNPGGRLELTEAGQRAFEYAERIFRLGRELCDAMEEERLRRTPSDFEMARLPGIRHSES